MKLLLLTAWLACAHDLQVAIERAAPVVLVKASYAGTEPAAFAQVDVYGPGSHTAFQNAHTDARGVFAFLPDAPGAWRVVVDDELGHRVETTWTVETTTGSSPGPATAGWPLPARAITGVSLLFGATGLLFWSKARRKT